MDANHFDNVARALASGSRRRFGQALGWLALGGSAAFLLPGPEGEAKRKKKKKCKRGTKKCGKKCIPATQCCPPFGCGMGAECVNGACRCYPGWKQCGAICIQDHQCCTDADCVDSLFGHTCKEHTCTCSGVSSNLSCCKPGEIYNYPERRCEAGPCPNDPLCDNGLTDTYLCGTPVGGFGVCARSASNRSVCINESDEARVCTNCQSDNDCVALKGSGYVCINPGWCRCGGAQTGFCAPVLPH